jgi:hypothetical protein|tara:strand:- start:3316 stop:3594 length:279 start_codon:yes stop_codon:yes gene_type:complete
MEAKKAEPEKLPEQISTPNIDASQENSMIEEARKAAERMEKANAERKLLIEREEKLTARRILGGQTSAGGATPVAAEETPVEYAKRVMAGKV